MSTATRITVADYDRTLAPSAVAALVKWTQVHSADIISSG